VKKIVLITTTQPSANPRVVKEANMLSANGFDVTVLYSYVADWAQEADKALLENVAWKYKQVGGNSKSSFEYTRSRFCYALYRTLNKYLSVNFFAEKAHARCYSGLLNAAIKISADYYIGHNPGAMAIAANAAKIKSAKAGFDFEDYYRGEYASLNDISAKRQIYLEQKYISFFAYLSASSQLIKERIVADFGQIKSTFITLLNCFSIKEQPVFRTENDNVLTLFWFSQHVGKDRGLQIVCEVLRELNDNNIHLTIAGNCTPGMKEYFVNEMSGVEATIHFAGVILPHELPSFSARFDVGLALEPAFSVNNDLALSNKIFTYLLAGNAVILSRTTMQNGFNEEYKVGQSFIIGNKAELKTCILFYKDSLNLLKQREYNFSLASSQLNWERESQKLLSVIA
jgi:hypothetical protein